MQKSLSLLWKIQNLEQKKRRLLAERKNIESREIEFLTTEMTKINQDIRQNKKLLQDLERSNAKQEKELVFMGDEAKKLEEKLYGNTVKSAKELEQIQKQLDDAHKELAGKEDALYADLEKAETLTAKVESNERLIIEKKALCAEKQQEIDEQLQQNKTQCDEIVAVCAELTAKVDKRVWDKYLALSKRIAQPIAKVENGICGGCRLGIPESQISNAAGQLVYCDNCGRIIFSEERFIK